MGKVWSVSKYTYKEMISNKIYPALIFGAIAIFAFLKGLSQILIYDGTSGVKTAGMFLIGSLTTIVIIYTASTQVLRGIKEKSIYLILTKGVSKGEYIVGSILGLILLGITSLLILGGVVCLISPDRSGIGVGLLSILLKIVILTSVGTMLSVISESYILALAATIATNALGSGSAQIYQISQKVDGPLKVVARVFYEILPKFHLLNFSDYLGDVKVKFIAHSIIYTLVYSIVVIAITILFFKRKRL